MCRQFIVLCRRLDLFAHAVVAKLLGMTSVPTLRLSHLSDVDRRAYILADNKLALNAGWDHEILAIEMQALIDLDFDLEITGFALAEVDLVLDAAREGDAEGPAGPEDQIPPFATAVSQKGDIWRLGRHRLACGDARDADVYGARQVNAHARHHQPVRPEVRR